MPGSVVHVEPQKPLEYSALPNFQKVETDPNQNEAMAIINRDSVKQDETTKSHTVSGVEYIAGEIKNHKRSLAISLSILLLALSGLGYRLFNNSTTHTKQIELIVVLPFVNASNDSDTAFLSDGISESLINNLS